MDEEPMPKLESSIDNQRMDDGDKDDRAQPSNSHKDNKVKKVVVDTSNMPEQSPIKYGIMNSEDIPINRDDDALYFTSLRIGKIQGLEGCYKCKILNFRNNLLEKIEGLDDMKEIEELELYDNRIRVIENIQHMTKMKYI